MNFERFNMNWKCREVNILLDGQSLVCPFAIDIRHSVLRCSYLRIFLCCIVRILDTVRMLFVRCPVVHWVMCCVCVNLRLTLILSHSWLTVIISKMDKAENGSGNDFTARNSPPPPPPSVTSRDIIEIILFVILSIDITITDCWWRIVSFGGGDPTEYPHIRSQRKWWQ